MCVCVARPFECEIESLLETKSVLLRLETFSESAEKEASHSGGFMCEKLTEDGDVEADQEGTKYPFKWYKVSPPFSNM